MLNVLCFKLNKDILYRISLNIKRGHFRLVFIKVFEDNKIKHKISVSCLIPNAIKSEVMQKNSRQVNSHGENSHGKIFLIGIFIDIT
jgi:hypothetical protein